jgi:hypothetical protein
MPVMVRLFYGTDLASAVDLLNNGVCAARAALSNVTGEFWATTNQKFADIFATANPSAVLRQDWSSRSRTRC